MLEFTLIHPEPMVRTGVEMSVNSGKAKRISEYQGPDVSLGVKEYFRMF